MDLSLTPINDLIQEIQDRSECFVMGYKLKNESLETIYTRWSDGSYFKNLALIENLKFDIIYEPNRKKELSDD